MGIILIPPEFASIAGRGDGTGVVDGFNTGDAVGYCTGLGRLGSPTIESVTILAENNFAIQHQFIWLLSSCQKN